jgi:hypothetical protein
MTPLTLYLALFNPVSDQRQSSKHSLRQIQLENLCVSTIFLEHKSSALAVLVIRIWAVRIAQRVARALFRQPDIGLRLTEFGIEPDIPVNLTFKDLEKGKTRLSKRLSFCLRLSPPSIPQPCRRNKNKTCFPFSIAWF